MFSFFLLNLNYVRLTLFIFLNIYIMNLLICMTYMYVDEFKKELEK
jgi:hypothetical protein